MGVAALAAFMAWAVIIGADERPSGLLRASDLRPVEVVAGALRHDARRKNTIEEPSVDDSRSATLDTRRGLFGLVLVAVGVAFPLRD